MKDFPYVEPFTPKLNPIPVLFKVIGASICFGIAFGLLWLLTDTGETAPNILIPGTLFLSFLGLIGGRTVYYLAQDVKWVKFDDKEVRVHYILRLNRLTVPNSKIKGFTKRNYFYEINRRSIIIHFVNNGKLEFLNSNYWSFSELETYVERSFECMGEENYHSKIWRR